MPDFTYDVGRVSFIMKGAWNLATNYEKLDAVTHDGSLYIAKQDVPGGTAITNTTYWQLAAEKGDQGDTGGVNSVNGQQGDIWFPDSRQLISDGYTTDTEPYLTKVNDSDSDRFELAKKLGNTVCVNQPLSNGDFHNGTTGWFIYRGSGSVSDGVLTITVGETPANCSVNTSASGYWIAGRKYLYMVDVKQDEAGEISVNTNGGSTTINNSKAVTTVVGSWVTLFLTFEASAYSSQQFNVWGAQTKAADDKWYMRNARVADLSIWYGSNDRIPSDLLAHPENWGRYYAGSLAYNAGTLDSADGTVMRSIGRNVWDEEWEQGQLNPSDGAPMASTTNVRAKNFIEIIPGADYYVYGPVGTVVLVFGYDENYNFVRRLVYNTFNRSFSTDGSMRYIKFTTNSDGVSYGGTYKNDITISLYYPGESGYDQYYPFSVLAEVDTGSEVLRSAGAVADEKTPDGTITRRVGVVDLGTLTYTAGGASEHRYYTTGLASVIKKGTDGGNWIQCAKYIPTPSLATLSASDGYMWLSSSGNVSFSEGSYASAAAFKTAMSGIYLYYELATPTAEQGTAFEPIVATVKNGVLSWTNTKGIPVGHESHWFENLRKRVEDRLPDPPSGDGTYRLTCTISGGVKTYSWEA